MSRDPRRLFAPAVAMVLAVAVLVAGSVAGGMHPLMGRGMMRGVPGRMMRMPSADVVAPGTRPENLPAPASRGAALVTRYCTQCHNLPTPSLHTAAEWPQVVERMRQNIAALQKIPFSDAEREEIVRYFQEHAGR